MNIRVGTSSALLTVLLAGLPAASTETVRLDGSSRQTHAFSGELSGVPGAVPLIGLDGVTDESCDPANCDETHLLLTLPSGVDEGRLLIRATTAIDNAGVGLRLLDAAGHVLSRGDGAALGVGLEPGLTGQHGAFIAVPRLQPGSYSVRVLAHGGAMSYEGLVHWRTR